MTIDTDNFFAPAGPTPDFVIGPAPGYIAGPAPDSVRVPAFGVIASRVALIVINPNKSNYFYRKQIRAEDFTSFKLYIKEIIWIGGIPFGETEKIWNFILSIPDRIQKAEVAKNLGHQFIFLVEKMGDEYQQFFDLVKRPWKKTGRAKDTMTSIITRLRFHINTNEKKSVFRIKVLVAFDKY